MLKALQESFVIRTPVVLERRNGRREIESATFFCEHSVLAAINTLADFTRGNVLQRLWDSVGLSKVELRGVKCRGIP